MSPRWYRCNSTLGCHRVRRAEPVEGEKRRPYWKPFITTTALLAWSFAMLATKQIVRGRQNKKKAPAQGQGSDSLVGTHTKHAWRLEEQKGREHHHTRKMPWPLQRDGHG